MLTLMLLRHAKAEPHGRGEDAARRLTPRGVEDAVAVGRYAAQRGLLPDFALVSSAVRTRSTLAYFVEGAERAVSACFDDGLYNATDAQLRATFRTVEAKIHTLMIIGHNPGIMDLACVMARHGDPADLNRLNERFPPSALAVIALEISEWRDAKSCDGRLDLLLTPDDLMPTE